MLLRLKRAVAEDDADEAHHSTLDDLAGTPAMRLASPSRGGGGAAPGLYPQEWERHRWHAAAETPEADDDGQLRAAGGAHFGPSVGASSAYGAEMTPRPNRSGAAVPSSRVGPHELSPD